MAKFTEVEQQFINRITDDRLVSNLAKIREAMEDIWPSDGFRLIQDYTDHGQRHCERLTEFATTLLKANNGTPLSNEERYLLLAGIYLHDIGMQCDVVRFHEIKRKAEQRGAQFPIEITAPASSRYSIDEQKIIRKNHHYLSAAWIDYAHRTGETVLGPAAKSIRPSLVEGLIQVCVHHTKLPIIDCPVSSRVNPNSRLRFVAALMRFADELDIAANRVNLNTVKTFNLSPQNSVYWWLHSRTTVFFLSNSLLTLTVELHPHDFEQYGPLIHEVFIAEFQNKNKPVLTVLAENNTPIVISEDSKVHSTAYAEPLPEEIIDALKAMQKKDAFNQQPQIMDRYNTNSGPAQSDTEKKPLTGQAAMARDNMNQAETSREVSIGGNMSGSVIIMGDGNRINLPQEAAAKDTSMQKQLSEARENLRLIEERKSQYVQEIDIPLQLIKEERHWRERIRKLEQDLSR